jgi:ABC-type uncharacterized transport system substrate-binding protein
MKKHEIAVFIENEEMLKEARELLEKYGESVCEDEMDMKFRYLTFDFYDKEWYVAMLFHEDTVITLPQLEEILKNQ